MSSRTVQNSSRTDRDGTHREGAGPYSHDFEPAFRPSEYVELHRLDHVHKVQAVEPVPAIDVTLSVTANGTNADQAIEELDVGENVMGQWRVLNSADIRDGTNVQIDQHGKQAVMYETKNQRGHIDTDTPDLAGESVFSELYQYEDRNLHATVVEEDGDGSDLTLTFSGWIYDLSVPQDNPPAGVDPWIVTDGPTER